MSRIEKFKNLPTRGSKEVAGSRLLLRAEKDTVQVTIRGCFKTTERNGAWHYETSLGVAHCPVIVGVATQIIPHPV